MRPPPRGSRPRPSAVLPWPSSSAPTRIEILPRCLFSSISWCASGTPSKPSVRHRTGPDLARLDQLVRLVALVCVGEVRADDLLLPHPQVAHVEVEVEPSRAGADHDLAERLDDEHRGGEGGLADVLEDDVGRVAEDLLHALRELARDLEARLLLVGRLVAGAHHPLELVAVDVVHRAELLHELSLVGARDHADSVGAGQRADLRREHAEPAGGAPDQHAVAGLDVAAGDQHAVGREVDEPVRGGLVPGEALRLRQQLLRLDLGELGERAPGGLVAPDLLARRGERIEAVNLGVLVGGHVAVDDDLVAGLPARDALADLPDDSRRVRAADVVAVLGVVAVAPDPHRLAERRPDVVVVHAGGHHAHDHLEGARLRHLDLLELEGVLRLALALLADHPGGHRLRQLARLDVQLRHLCHVHGHAGREITERPELPPPRRPPPARGRAMRLRLLGCRSA